MIALMNLRTRGSRNLKPPSMIKLMMSRLYRKRLSLTMRVRMRWLLSLKSRAMMRLWKERE